MQEADSVAMTEPRTVAAPPAQVRRDQQQDDDEDDDVDLGYAARSLLSLLTPVSVTMILSAVMVVHLTNDQTSEEVGLSSYEVSSESEGGDDDGSNAAAALTNALVFVGAIAVVTFLLVLLYYFRCMKVLYGWLVVSVVLLLGGTGGYVVVRVIDVMDWNVDIVTYYVFLWNFSIVGTLAIFWKSPMKLQQAYLVLVSAIMAFILAQLQEWTTWAFVIGLALYDLCAVLCPGGPLNLLIGLAQERGDPIPALLYEARPNENQNAEESPASGGAYVSPTLQNSAPPGQARDDVPLRGHTVVAMPPSREAQVTRAPSAAAQEERSGRPAPAPVEARHSDEQLFLGDDDDEKSVRLGLGDFVIYSVIVARSALFGMVTAVSVFVGILNGLAATLTYLAVMKKPLPALPFSVLFGVFFYFVTRLLVTPYQDEFVAEGLFV